MRLGIDVRELEKGKITGIGRYLLGFLKFCAAEKTDWDFVLFANQRTRIPLKSPNFKIVRIPEFLTAYWDQVLLPAHIKKEKIDVFLSPYFKAPLSLSCKLVVIISDIIPLVASSYRGAEYLFLRMYFRFLIKRVIRRADRIITISYHTKNNILREFLLDENKISVITLAVDKGLFKPVDPPSGGILGKYGLWPGKFIFYFGNFNPHKNVPMLIKAYRDLPVELKAHYQLAIGGKKDKRFTSLFAFVSKFNLRERVVFTGAIPDEDLPVLYSASSVFVFPSLYEGFGLPPLEAMACGTPVIAFNVSSLPEVIGGGGILLDSYTAEALSQAITRILTEQGLRKNLVARGLARAALFSEEKMARGILEAITDQDGYQHTGD